MTQTICDKRQEYISKQGDDIVPKVKVILGDSFHKGAAMEVVKLVWGNQYMVTESKGSMCHINLNVKRQTTEPEEVHVTTSEVGKEMQLRMKTNVLTVVEQSLQ